MLTDDEQIDQMMYEAEMEQRKEDQMTKTTTWKTSTWIRCPYCGRMVEEQFTGDKFTGHRCPKCRWQVKMVDDPVQGAMARPIPYEDEPIAECNET